MCRSKPWARDCQATGTSHQRRNSHAAAAVDLLAATPPISATTLTAALDVAVKTAVRPLDGLITVGIAVEVTRRSMRRLFGLKGMERLAETVRPPGRGRLPIVAADGRTWSPSPWCHSRPRPHFSGPGHGLR
jgi:hypothetical protein